MNPYLYQLNNARLASDSCPFISVKSTENTTYPLSSTYSPSAEAQRILAKPSTSGQKASLVVILGAGNLALIVETLKHYPHTPILLLTSDAALLKLALKQLKTLAPHHNATFKQRKNSTPPSFYTFAPSTPLSLNTTSAQAHPSATAHEPLPPSPHPTLELAVTQLKHELNELFKTHSTRHIRFYSNPREVTRTQAFYNLIQQTLLIEQDEKSINRATFSRFEKIWLRNLVKNTKTIIDAVPITQLFPLIKDYPVAIIGAGPSLAQDLPLLKKVQNNLLLIAVDTVYGILLRHEIYPDLIVSIDPQKINAKYLETTPPAPKHPVALIAEPSISHHALKKFQTIFMFDNFSPYYDYLTSFFTPKGALKVGGSVATVACELLNHTQAHAALLLGIDLCYSQERYHLPGALHEEIWFTTTHRLDNFSTRLFSIMSSKDVVPVHTREQKIAYSDAAMELYRRWLGKNAENNLLPLYHATLQAPAIENIPPLSLKKFIKRHASRTRDKSSLHHALKSTTTTYRRTFGSQSPFAAKQLPAFHEATTKLIARLEHYKWLGKDAAQLIHQHKSQASAPHFYAKLASFNEKLQIPSIEKKFVGSIMQKTFYHITDSALPPTQSSAPQSSNPKLHLEKALLLYNEVVHASDLNIRYLKSLLKTF